MPAPTPPISSDRRLGWLMVALIPLPVGVAWLDIGLDELPEVFGYLAEWTIEQWAKLRDLKWPKLSRRNIEALLFISLFLGPTVLVPWHLWVRLMRSGAPAPRGLWLWSGVFGLVCVAIAGWEVWAFFRLRYYNDPLPVTYWAYLVGNAVFGPLLTVLGLRAWWRGRGANG